VFAARAAELDDVFEKGDFDLSAGLPVPSPDQFGLQRFDEAFDGGIALTVAFPAHRNLDPVLAQQLLIVAGTIVRPAIHVLDAAWWRPSDCDGHARRKHRLWRFRQVDNPGVDIEAFGIKLDHKFLNVPVLESCDWKDMVCLEIGLAQPINLVERQPRWSLCGRSPGLSIYVAEPLKVPDRSGLT
jgi:hypothetical protein